MDNQQTERTIYFKDLVFAVLYKWRAVLAAMLIGAVLLGGLEMLDASGEVTLHSVSVTPENQIKIDQYQSTLERTELLIESHDVYLEESILMTLDSYAAYTADLYVSAHPASEADYDRMAAVLYAHCAGITDTAVMEELGKKFGMKPIYLQELITAQVTEAGVLQISVRGRTLEEAEAIASALKAVLESRQEELGKTIAPHGLQISSFRSGPAVDKALYDLQNIAQQRMTTLKNTVTNTTTELNKLLPTQLQAGKPQPLLFAVVGAFLGAFLVAMVAVVAHIGSGKVYSARTLKDCSGVRVLGCVGEKTRDPIDRWLRKLEGRATDARLDGIVANIINRCADKKLLVVGAGEEKLLRALADALTGAGVQCAVCPESAGSAQAIRALRQCDAAVLVETCGKSSYDDVIWTAETANEYGKTLVGCVLIDG